MLGILSTGFAVLLIVVISYLVILFSSSVMAPKVPLWKRAGYLAVTLGFTGLVLMLGTSIASDGAKQVIWQAGTWSVVFTRVEGAGIYRMMVLSPLWSLIPAFMGIGFGLALRSHLARAQAPEILPTPVLERPAC